MSELDKERRAEEAGKVVMTARLALRRNQRVEARKLLAQALKIDPSDIGALDMLGDMFLEDAEQEKAIQVFEHGLKHHPEHAPFEEKLGLAKLDLAEMERDQLMKESALQNAIANGLDPGYDKLLDKKPPLALGLSVIVPGAGQLYNDEYEKGGAFFALWFFIGLGWFNLLFNKMRAMQEASVGRHIMPSMAQAIEAMSSGQRAFFWFLVLLWLAVMIAAATDAALSATRLNEERRRQLGLLGD
jgi:tetratricopeptide (TPR) repeat protein